MDSDLDSDVTDFWQDLTDIGEIAYNFSPDSKYPGNSSINFSQSLFKQDFGESAKVLRDLNYKEGICARLDEQAAMRDHIKFTIDRLKTKFKHDTASKVSKNSIMRRELYDYSKDNNILWNYLIDQEVLITQFKYQNELLRKLNMPIKLRKHYIERDKLYKEIDLIKEKTDALLRTRSNIEKECEMDKVKLGLLVKELESIKKCVFQEYFELEKQNLDLLNTRKMENEKLMKEYQDFKQIKLKELDECEQTCTKNTELIALLQAELKSAKTIMQKPELKTKVFKKLQDYIDHFDEDEHYTRFSASKNDSIYQRRVYSSKAISAVNISGTEINIGTSTTMKHFKFYSKKPTLASSKASISKNLKSHSNAATRFLSAIPRINK